MADPLVEVTARIYADLAADATLAQVPVVVPAPATTYRRPHCRRTSVAAL